ncbi:hypothetical protein FEM03_13490 [Phragmitibacter flavus]|uniref:Uncharacterized protein n=1 Tax=Phragmitibacter flavus TaxID=2576071 RepID=A0A5R8KD13_9BACT|nr:hypothetical protein [Phragmitibacter flavus]TLD70198.1 hypothetical protein FEM03_13490 [Phragmitibacter flavus]
MDLELKTLGQTLAVGGLAIFLVIVWVAALLRDPEWPIQKLARMDEGFPLIRGSLFLSIVLVTGILCENYSRRVASGRGHLPFKGIFSFFIESDKQIRLRSLLTVHKFKDDFIEVALSPIAVETLQLPQIGSLLPYQRESIQHIVDASRLYPKNRDHRFRIKGIDECSIFVESINAMYYLGKNAAFRHENHFLELREIEARFNFSGAVAFIGLVGFPIGLVVLAFSWYRNRPAFRLSVFSVAICILLAVFGRSSYVDERLNFNLRIYGYMKAEALSRHSE